MWQVAGMAAVIILGAAVFAPVLVITYVAKKIDDYTNEKRSKWDEQ
jgi:hypothetical protein